MRAKAAAEAFRVSSSGLVCSSGLLCFLIIVRDIQVRPDLFRFGAMLAVRQEEIHCKERACLLGMLSRRE